MNRRELIGLSGAFAASCAIGHRFAHAGAGYPFTLGVAAGQPSPDGFVIWTRLAPIPLASDGLGGMGEPVPVTWEVALDEGMRVIAGSGTTDAHSALAHSVHVELTGLQPGRPYWYRFTALGAQSPIGVARTAPASGARPAAMRFAFASCANWEVGYYSAYRHLAAENPDLVLFLGDYIYESTYPEEQVSRLVRRHDGPAAADLTAYRNRYALYRTDPDLQALHAAAPCVMTWDDHEVENDYANEWSERIETTPEEFLRRRAAAYQAYYEHMPLRSAARPRGGAMRLYDRFRFGDLVTFAVLDGRQYRSKQPCATPLSRRGHVAPETCDERLDPQRTLLGAAQEQWLFEGLKQSDAAWNVIAQQQLVAQLHQKDRAGMMGYWTDGWDGYPAARRRMLEAIAAVRPGNPVFIGGDIHSFWATDLKADFNRPSPTIATEFVGSSITSDPPPHEAIAAVLPDNPHVRYFESRRRGYVAVDVARDRMDVRMQMISDRRDPNAMLSTLKRFVVENGKPGAVPD
jgi:alkaline phosphatase D